jgi:hypothetical protein
MRALAGIPMDRMEAIEKLVDEFHLNVEERKTFLESPLLKEELVAAIVKIISRNDSYPSNWKSADDFEGVFLAKKDAGYVATYKVEEGLMRYSIIEIREFGEKEEAAKYAIERMFGGVIDGIEIN